MSRKLKAIQLIVASIVAALLLAGCGSPADKTDEPVKAAEEVTATEKPAAEDGEKAAEEDAQESEAAEKPAAKSEWKTLAKLSGEANKQSDTFALKEGKTRLSYEFEDTSGMNMIIAAIYVLPEGTDLEKDGGLPEVMISEAGKDTTIIRKSPGDYYLRVLAANTKYTVKLEVQE